MTTSLAGSEHDAWAESATAVLPAALAWLRIEVAAAYSGHSDGSRPPREALRTLLVVLEELQHLLPLAIASLVDDALVDERSGIAADDRHRARWDLLSRGLLTADEVAALPREALISLAVQRFRAHEAPVDMAG